MLMETDDCILSNYRRKEDGYGVVWIDGKPRSAHIMACEREHGARPAGMTASHLCGNNLCINRRHLIWETFKDNLRRRREHGTDPTGARNPKAKLTDDDVREIRRRRAAGELGTTLAKEFGVTSTQIYTITSGKQWRHI